MSQSANRNFDNIEFDCSAGCRAVAAMGMKSALAYLMYTGPIMCGHCRLQEYVLH